METVWITKYALSEGIYPVKLKDIEERFASVYDKDHPFNTIYQNGDWHKTEAEAKKKANEMRLKKIKSLEKQIEKLKKLEF